MDLQENFAFVEDLDDTPKETLEICRKRYAVTSKTSAPAIASAETLIVLSREMRPLWGDLTEEIAVIARKGKLFKTGEGEVVYVSEERVVENENYLALSLLGALSPKKVIVVDGRLGKEERLRIVTAPVPDAREVITGIVAAFWALATIRGFQLSSLLLEYPGFRPPVRLLMEAQRELGNPEVDVEVMRKRVEKFMPIDLGASLYL